MRLRSPPRRTPTALLLSLLVVAAGATRLTAQVAAQDTPTREGPTAGTDPREAEVGRLRGESASLRAELGRLVDLVARLRATSAALTNDLLAERSDALACEEEANALRDALERRSAGSAVSADGAMQDALLVAAARARRAERQRLMELHADELVTLRREHEETIDRFLRFVTERHDSELQRRLETSKADCQARTEGLRLAQEAALRRARKESGWEREFREALREQVELELSEAKARWEAKQRGDVVDCDIALRRQREELEARAAAERTGAVNAAVVADRTAVDARVREAVRQEERRCQLALEIVIERLGEVEDLPATCESLRRALRGSVAETEPPVRAP